MSEHDGLGSGTSGLVFGIRATTKAAVRDAAAGAVDLLTLQGPRLRRAAARWPRRSVLAISVERTDVPNLLPAARAELLRSRHAVTFAHIDAGDRGRFENLNALLTEHPARRHDWLLVVDDDVVLPRGFLDAFVFLAERFQLRLAQPAHRANSHAAWQVTRRRPQAIVRETRFVEIGPVVGFHRITFEALLPFPPLRFGWGLDQHWSAVALEHGWRIGVVDATPIRHGLRRIAASYAHHEAMAEAREFLGSRPYTARADAQRTLVMHRSWT